MLCVLLAKEGKIVGGEFFVKGFIFVDVDDDLVKGFDFSAVEAFRLADLRGALLAGVVRLGLLVARWLDFDCFYVTVVLNDELRRLRFLVAIAADDWWVFSLFARVVDIEHGFRAEVVAEGVGGLKRRQLGGGTALCFWFALAVELEWGFSAMRLSDFWVEALIVALNFDAQAKTEG